MMNGNSDDYLRINEIKNALYCPRISYYTLCLNIDRETDLSREGIAAEQTTKRRMQRRKQALHAIHEGERYFDLSLVSHRLRLVGRLDEWVKTEAGVYLVDYKDSTQDYGYWRLQMCAYRMAAEEMGERVLGAYIYSIPTKAYSEVVTTRKDMARLETLVGELRVMIEQERCPPPVSQVGKCRSCQYCRFCNDVF
jgi:CRISPR-associated protein Cas4